MEGRLARILIKLGSAITLAFLYVPLLVVVIYAFNKSRLGSMAAPALHVALVLRRLAGLDPARRHRNVASSLPSVPPRSRWSSGRSRPSPCTSSGSSGATPCRSSWFCRSRCRVSSRRSRSSRRCSRRVGRPASPSGWSRSSWDMRRSASSWSSTTWSRGSAGHRDPGSRRRWIWGATARTTFRRVTLPNLRTALVAAALLAFGLSFDEIVVTKYLAGTTLTLPLWIYNHIARPIDRPIVNVVSLVVLLVIVDPGVHRAAPRRAPRRASRRAATERAIDEAGPG